MDWVRRAIADAYSVCLPLLGPNELQEEESIRHGFNTSDNC